MNQNRRNNQRPGGANLEPPANNLRPASPGLNGAGNMSMPNLFAPSPNPGNSNFNISVHRAAEYGFIFY
jgi:hypothetical protein